jgi:hypothetical protein
MKRFFINIGATLGASLITGAIVSACAHNDASIVLEKVFQPTIPSNGSCTFTADPTQASISTGQVDLSFSDITTYTPEVLVGNQIVSQGNVNQLQAETSTVIVSGAITRITDLDGNTSLIPLLAARSKGGDQGAKATGEALQAGQITAPINPFSTVETTTIAPASGATASYAALSLTMVDSATLAVLRQYFTSALTLNTGVNAGLPAPIQLLTYTKLEGKTIGGDTVESNEYEFAVTITYAGLVSNLGVGDTASASGYCVDTTIKVPTSGQTCLPGQDVPIIVGAVAGLPICPPADGGTITSDTDAGAGFGLTDGG